jgi:Glycosyltransferases, probably involved in cell wall biogenesis
MLDIRIKNQDPLVSVLIPVYNKAKFLQETLYSTLNQSYSNTEIILVNDGSTDDSFEILQQYSDQYPDKITLIDSANRGVSAATNLCLQHAKGEFIQFLDADDLMSPNKIEKQVQLLSEKTKGAIAAGEWVNFTHDFHQSAQVPYGVFQDFESGLDLLLRFWNNQEMMAISSYLTHRDLIEKAGSWDENLTINQDGEFFARVLLHAEKVLFEPEGKVYYRSPGATNVSQQKSRKAMKSLLESYQAYERAVLQMEDSDRVRIALKKVYQKFIYDVFPRYPDLIEKAESLIQNLGVSEKTYIGGPKFQQLSKYLGFKNALRLKRLASLRGK